MKLAGTGHRKLVNHEWLEKEELPRILSKVNPSCVISGGAKGFDELLANTWLASPLFGQRKTASLRLFVPHKNFSPGLEPCGETKAVFEQAPAESWAFTHAAHWRNLAMVRACDIMVAGWNHGKGQIPRWGGTRHALMCAAGEDKPVILCRLPEKTTTLFSEGEKLSEWLGVAHHECVKTVERTEKYFDMEFEWTLLSKQATLETLRGSTAHY